MAPCATKLSTPLYMIILKTSSFKALSVFFEAVSYSCGVFDALDASAGSSSIFRRDCSSSLRFSAAADGDGDRHAFFPLSGCAGSLIGQASSASEEAFAASDLTTVRSRRWYTGEAHTSSAATSHWRTWCSRSFQRFSDSFS